MRHAILIQAHHEPEVLDRLVEYFDGDWAHCFIHIDAKADIRQFDSVARRPNVTMVARRVDIKWGGWSQVQATLNLIDAARAAGGGFRYFGFLSGVTLPTRSAEILRALLDQSRCEFISAVSVPNESVHKYLDRFDRRYIEGGYRRAGVKAWLIRLANKALQTAPRQIPVTLRGKLWAGSNWWFLTNHAIEAICAFRQTHPDDMRFFRSVFRPDESFFQTIVMSTPFAQNRARDFTYTDGSNPVDGVGHIRIDHVERLLDRSHRLSGPYGESEIYFARKFACHNLHLAEELHRRLNLAPLPVERRELEVMA